MAAFVTPHIPGFAPGDPVPSAAMNLINTQLPKAPNWVDGGAEYNPTDQLVMGGAGMRWTGPTEFGSLSETEFESGATVTLNGAFYIDGPGAAYLRTSGRIVVQSTGEISVQSGGDLNVESGGAMTWEDGSIVTAQDGSTFLLNDGSVMNVGGIMTFSATNGIHGDPALKSGAELTTEVGSTVTFNGTATFANSTWPALSPARTWSRRNLRMVGTEDPTKVEEIFGQPMASSSTTPYIEIANQSPAFMTLLEIDDLPDGQTITSVVVRSVGVTGAPIITDAATYQVVRWTNETGRTAMSAATDDAHTSGNWSTTALDTTITITSNSTIDRSYRYGVEVMSHNVVSGDSLRIISVRATGTASSIRV